jgi:hypothetical protein
MVAVALLLAVMVLELDTLAALAVAAEVVLAWAVESVAWMCQRRNCKHPLQQGIYQCRREELLT